MKKRLDQLLVERGLFESRARAQAAILAGKILAGNSRTLKAGSLVDEKIEIRSLEKDMPYVGRGGLKLEKALDEFNVSPKGRVCLDIGASTGGFTDCLLQRGAAKVYAVDVGYGQLDLKIRNDAKVVVIERTNARSLTAQQLYGDGYSPQEMADLAVMDVSFISITKIFPALLGLLKDNADVVSLVKPQFEAGKDLVGKGGIVRDPATHKLVLNNVIKKALESGFRHAGTTVSPVTGADGNTEFFVHLLK